MAVLLSSLITQIDRHTGDTSTDRFSAADRYDAITEACVWLQEEHQSELQNFTYALSFYDTMNYYTISTVLSDLLMASDLRKMEGENFQVFTFKNDKQISEDISNSNTEDGYTIERKNDKAYIAINHQAKYPAVIVSRFESLTDGGTWTLDETTSDAENLTLDTSAPIEGTGCLMFDADVSNTANDRVSIYATDINSLDFTSLKGHSSGFLEIYLPIVTYFSSVTLTWGTDTSNYWSATVTTPVSGAWAVGVNTVKVPWTGTTTVTGTPDVEDINYIRIDFNYTASQADATGYRVDFLRFAQEEILTLHYLSWNVGKDTNGAAISVFGAGTDTPFFSGLYDQMKYAVGHYAAGVLLQDLRLQNEADEQFKRAYERLRAAKDIIPSSRVRETKNFKPTGINFNRRGRTKSRLNNN